MAAPSTFGDWLKAARQAQTQPENGRPWTQDYFLDRLRAETGWAPTKAPYIALERGESQPRPENRARFIAFWKAHGVELPELTPPAPVLTYEQEHLELLREANKINGERLVEERRTANALSTIAAAFTPGAPTTPLGQSMAALIHAFVAQEEAKLGSPPPQGPGVPATSPA